MDNNLYVKIIHNHIIMLEVYVDHIVFSSDKDGVSHAFAQIMQQEFEIPLLGELNFFLGLQILQKDNGIHISKSNSIYEMLKKF